MAKVIYKGSAKPDDPIYKTGPVIGGIRIGKSVKNGKYDPKKKDPKGVPTKKPQTT